METTVKERPWVAKQHEAQAIAGGRKTQLRILAPVFEGKDLDKLLALHPNQHGCPLGEVGQLLWVRETWARVWDDEDGHADHIEYRADTGAAAPGDWDNVPKDERPAYARWQPSIHMPRAASRLLLEITEVRVERVQAISEADAIAEGIEKMNFNTFTGKPRWKHYRPEDLEDGALGWGCPTDSYMSLWQSINGPDSWAANPWCWVISFKVINPIGAATTL